MFYYTKILTTLFDRLSFSFLNDTTKFIFGHLKYCTADVQGHMKNTLTICKRVIFL